MGKKGSEGQSTLKEASDFFRRIRSKGDAERFNVLLQDDISTSLLVEYTALIVAAKDRMTRQQKDELILQFGRLLFEQRDILDPQTIDALEELLEILAR